MINLPKISDIIRIHTDNEEIVTEMVEVSLTILRCDVIRLKELFLEDGKCVTVLKID